MTLKFVRNKVVEVEPRPGGILAVSWRLTDDLLKAEVEVAVEPPELEIVEARARLERLPTRECQAAAALIEKIVGVSVGPGLRKIVGGLLAGPEGSSVLADAVLECCNAVILHFTRPGIELGDSITDPDEKMTATREMLKANPRLVRSCIAFQDGSPIMEGLEL